MSNSIDVPLDTLFMSEVIKNNTNPDGTEKDKNLLTRMQHPICIKCQEQFKVKYPNKVFQISCRGIYSDRDFAAREKAFKKKFPDEEYTQEDRDNDRGVYDVVFWAERNIVVKDDTGNLIPFKARWYQEETLRCTARHKVDRWGRGLGKTICGVIEELHKALTRKNLDVLIVCPADSQSEKWYTEIEFQINHSPTLKGLEIRQKQQPFKIFKFVGSGSSIAIFTAGSASGRGANSIRSQDPWRVRLDEQDYLNDNDYKAIDPLIVRHEPVSEFHGSSTPTGVRSRFWQMCTQMPTYREFYFPISVHPNWSEELQTLYRMQAKTDDVYRHEYLAEFSDPISGVFKSIHVDAAKTDYHNPDMPSLKGYDCEKYNAALRYFMGIDWNGKGTGTRIRVVSYDPTSKVRKCVAAVTVDEEGATTTQSIQAIIDLNRKWHCEDIFVDAGFGFAQDELIRLAGRNGTDRDTQKLQDIHTIDFGAQLVFNRLISKRDPDKQTRYLPDPKDEELKRMTKPFMVEGAVMVFEHRLIQFSSEDKILEEQLRSYRVKTYSNHGYANTYEVDGDCGDHDLDAFMLALMAVEQKYGLFASKESYRRLATFSYVPGWGVPSPAAPTSDKPTSIIDQKMDRAGVPSRQMPRDKNDEYRIAYLTKNGSGQPSGMIAPINRGEAIRTGVPSRTSAFKGNPRSRGGNSRGRF
jgi:hypothetical protein